MKHLNRRNVLSLAGFTLLAARAGAGAAASATGRWIEGRHYFDLGANAAKGQAPAAVKVTEIFSYACSGCDAFLPYMQSLERNLPAGAVVEYLPAAWHPSENWPLYQRTFLAARTLGVDKKAHEAMFAAVWKTGELAVLDARTGRRRSPLPSVQDVARFYERVAAIPAARFVETAMSFTVDSAMRSADARIKGMRPDSTPTLVINDRYRVDLPSAGGSQQLVEVALFLASSPRHA